MSPPELGLLDGAEGVEDGGFGRSRASGSVRSSLRSGPGIDGRARYLTVGSGERAALAWRSRGPTACTADAARATLRMSARAPRRANLAPESRAMRDASRVFDTPRARHLSCERRDAARGAASEPARASPERHPSAAPLQEFDRGRRRRPARRGGQDVRRRGGRRPHRPRGRDGEFFSLLGPSGCGKTTTLRMIGGFEQPTSGLIELQGQDVTWLPPYQRNVNTVFQNYALFPHLTIFENVAFGLRREGVKDAEVKSRVTEMLELVELPGFEQRKPTQISGGQAQRVALARALINRPAVLLLDEPLGALDLKLRKQMQVELKRIQQEVGITFIYVTHDQEEAMTMSDRIAVMNKGQYEQLGDPEALYERPTTRFVAGFLGVSNLLPGDRRGRRRRLCGRPPRRRHAPSARRAPSSTGHDRGRASASGPRRSGSTSRRGHAPGRPQPPDGRRSRRLVPRRQHAVPGRGARAGHGHGLRAERRTRHEGRAVDARRGGRQLTWSPDHTLRGRRDEPSRRRGRLGR